MGARVGTSNQVMHAWAHGHEGFTRNGNGTVTREGSAIYSYARCIGNIVRHADGNRVLVLISGVGRSSVTTSQHISGVRRAASHLSQVTVADIGGRGAMASLVHERNREYFDERIAALLDEVKRSRTEAKREWRLSSAQLIANEANAYRDFFGLAEFWPLFTLGEESAERLVAARRAREEAEAKRQAEALMLEAERRDAWLAGMMVAAPRQGGPYLRVCPSSVTECLETSWGARVPLAEAIAVFKLAAACRAKGEGWMRSVRMRVGDFSLDSIGPDGTIRVGCHTIPWEESSRLAAKLGILEGVA